jgi:NAD(P)-dependent dehydrogenase (short-subunit alcohol dehydrogenase family)
MRERFAGKRVLVTGSTRGIGHAAARRLLEEGATVILHGRTPQAVAHATDAFGREFGDRASGLAADLADRGQCRRLSARVGAVDVLVNCAGVYEEVPIEAADDAHWRRILDVNTTAPWLLAQALLPGLRERAGVIVNVSSDSGLLGYPGSAVYCASKGALIGLTRALAVELAPAVRVLAVCPGPVETDMMRDAMSASSDPQAVRESWQSATLLGRIAAPEEIAAAIAFAASPDCSYATGTLLSVDGGTTSGRRVG